MRLEERLSNIESLLARIDERTAHFANKITQQELAMDDLKKRSWMTAGASAFAVWVLAEWEHISTLFNKH